MNGFWYFCVQHVTLLHPTSIPFHKTQCEFVSSFNLSVFTSISTYFIENTDTTTTTTTLQQFYGSVDFVRDNPDEPVPEETFTHSHSLWSSIIPICFLHLLWSMVSSLFNPRALQSLSTISLQVFFGLALSWPSTLHFTLHTFLHPISIFFSQHMPIPSQPVLL